MNFQIHHELKPINEPSVYKVLHFLLYHCTAELSNRVSTFGYNKILVYINIIVSSLTAQSLVFVHAPHNKV